MGLQEFLTSICKYAGIDGQMLVLMIVIVCGADGRGWGCFWLTVAKSFQRQLCRIVEELTMEYAIAIVQCMIHL